MAMMATPAPERPPRPAFTLIELLVVLGIVSILLGLTLAAVQRVRGAAARLKCQNNLRQIALAMLNYESARQTLPTGHRPFLNPRGMAFSGWPLDILPYLEQHELHAQGMQAYQTSPNAFRNPPHTGLSTPVGVYVCPLDGRVDAAQVSQRTRTLAAFTSYLGVSGLNRTTRDGVLHQASRVRLLEILDGTSQTLLLGERPPSADFQFGWWYAGVGFQLTGAGDMILGVRETNLPPIVPGAERCPPGTYPFMRGRLDDPCSMFHFWSLHSGGANFAFADGSVRFLSYSANALMPALATRAGGEAVEQP